MGTTSTDSVVDIETLETPLLSPEIGDEAEALYTASFEETEENFIKYRTTKYVLLSLVFVLVWGIGLVMLLYLPLLRYSLRKDFRSRKVYVTPNSIVYNVTKPVTFPCFGGIKKEKYVLLPAVDDVVIEQGYLQSFFGVHSIRIENAGVRRPPNHGLKIVGIANPSAFRKAVFAQLANMRTEAFTRQLSATDDASTMKVGHPRSIGLSPSSELLLLQKLEEVGTSVKRLQALIEEHQFEASERVG